MWPSVQETRAAPVSSRITLVHPSHFSHFKGIFYQRSTYMVADMKVDMVDDMVVDMVAEMEVDKGAT